MHLVSALTILFLQVNGSVEQIGSLADGLPAQVAAGEAEIAPARRKVSKRHLEIIDALAANPERKRTKGSSLERDAQKMFQEEGLDEMKGATIRRYMRDSAIKQGIPNRNVAFTEAHEEIMKEVCENADFKSFDLFQAASNRFDEAGLQKVSYDLCRRYYTRRSPLYRRKGSSVSATDLGTS